MSGEQLGALIQQGHQVMKMENETQAMLSIQRPRDEKKVLEKVIGELEDVPEFAMKAFYSIPYKNREEGTVSLVEGPSIGASMAIARRWGNCATANRVLEEREDKIICEGVFLDYETNNRVCRQVAVSRFYVPKGSSQRKPLGEKMLNLAIAAGLSKAVRNAVLHGVPESLKIQYVKAAKGISGSVKTPKGLIKKSLTERLADLIEGFKAQGVSKEEIMRYNGKDSVKEPDYSRLLGVLNALEDGLMSKDDMFVKQDPAKEAKPPVKLGEVLDG